MKQTIEIPEGFELKKVSDTEYRIVKKENVLPKTWVEFCDLYPVKRDEFYIENGSAIIQLNCKNRNFSSDRNILPSKEKAEAILALCQLIQLRDCYNDGWKPDWNNSDKNKFVIYPDRGEFITGININSTRILAFESSELRDEFLDNFKDLIEKLKPLYK